MKKLLLVLALTLLAGGTTALAQTAGPEIVVVRVSEVYGARVLIITRGAGKSEVIPFVGGSRTEDAVITSEVYYKALSQLYQEGFAAQATLPTSPGITTILFVKVPKP